jgi:hypothetical protein
VACEGTDSQARIVLLIVFNCSVLSFGFEIKNPSEQNPQMLYNIDVLRPVTFKYGATIQIWKENPLLSITFISVGLLFCNYAVYYCIYALH